MKYISTINGNIVECSEQQYIDRNLEVKGYIIYIDPIIPPIPPDYYSLFNVEKALAQLNEIFFVKLLSYEGMCSVIMRFIERKDFYTLNQFVFCKYWEGRDESTTPITEGLISDSEYTAFMLIFSEQNIDLTKQPKRVTY